MSANQAHREDRDEQESTIKVTKRTSYSLCSFLLQNIMKLFTLVKLGDPYPAGSPALEPPEFLEKQCTVQARVEDEINIYDLIPRHPAQNDTKPSRRIYYFNGGGWQKPASKQHWSFAQELALKLPGTTVSIVSYPLAPQCPASVTIPWLVKLLATLMRQAADANQDVILAGDSAGGNIIVCLTLEALRENPDAAVPKALMAISPTSDLAHTNPAMHDIAKHDPILNPALVDKSSNAWRGEWDAKDPRVSPVYADVTPFVRRGVQVHGVSGSYDILNPEILQFRDNCAAAGVRGEWLEWDKQVHCFPLAFAYHLPESVAAKDWILDVLRKT